MSIQHLNESDIEKAAEEFDNMLFKIVTKGGLFTPSGNNLIKYKGYRLRREKSSWNIYLNNRLIASTFLKVSAFAICKAHEERKTHQFREILDNDKVFERNFVDGLFLKHTATTSKDEVSKDTAQWRLEQVACRAKHAKARIDSMFYSSLV